jgi:branched-chain amino acid transport system permease protein
MDFSIASILVLDGVTNGAIYALLAIALVLVFAVTRVIFIAQGEFVAYGALTLAMFQMGKLPGTVWLLLVLALLVALLDGAAALRRRDQPCLACCSVPPRRCGCRCWSVAWRPSPRHGSGRWRCNAC